MDFAQKFAGKMSVVTKKGLKANILETDYSLPKSLTVR